MINRFFLCLGFLNIIEKVCHGACLRNGVVPDYVHCYPMPRLKTVASSRPRGNASAPSVSQKFLAEHLGLSPATVSLVINRSPAAKSIPHRTQERIRQAARELNYRPNFVARSLRAQRSFTIGVVVPEISEGYAALVMSGIEDHLLEEG